MYHMCFWFSRLGRRAWDCRFGGGGAFSGLELSMLGGSLNDVSNVDWSLTEAVVPHTWADVASSCTFKEGMAFDNLCSMASMSSSLIVEVLDLVPKLVVFASSVGDELCELVDIDCLTGNDDESWIGYSEQMY